MADQRHRGNGSPSEKLRFKCADPEGGTGGSGPPPPHRKIQNKGFLINTGPDPLKNHKATKPAFNDVPSSARQRRAGGRAGR